MVTTIKNFLAPELIEKIKARVFSQDFPWYFRNNMVNNDHFWFNHSFYREGKSQSPHYEEWILPIINKLNYKILICARCNMTIKENKSYTSDLHTDYKLPNLKTAIFYLNTCNGGTVLMIDSKEKFIETEENKIIIFPGETLHRAVSQTDVDRRIVFNINYV